MSAKLKIFLKEFKLNIVKLYLKCNYGGCKILFRNLGFNDHRLLLRWVQRYREYGKSGLENMSSKAEAPNDGAHKLLAQHQKMKLSNRKPKINI